jgi:hypothetical protein
MRRSPRERRAIVFLEAHGAEHIEHPGGTLLAHLRRTADRLEEWDARSSLVLAGLCHATYGTDGFPTALIDPSRRAELVDTIGADAEAIVHFYASCDRAVFLPQLGRQTALVFRDRFSSVEFTPDPHLVQDFVELTFANELDVMLHSAELAALYGADVTDLVERCACLASHAATSTVARLLPKR